MLDELHNFFPELLYDESLFSETFVKFMRYRAKQLFPTVFERQQNLYRIYQASRRATEAAHWLPTLPVVTITPTIATTTTTTTTAPLPQGSSPLPTSAAAAPSSRRRRVVADPMEELLNALLNPMLTQMTYSATTIGGTGASWQDVPVTATREQIAAGSTLVVHEEVPADTQCAICMDHDSDTTHQWRRLHCEHYFHKSCIDQWFNRNVHCPVCRADIRNHEEM